MTFLKQCVRGRESILWTALSLALGLEIRGEVIRGVPCIKRFHQLFCPTAGNSYPIDRIERFIDDNKSLMRRMYGEFQMTTEYGPPAREVFETPASTTATGPPGGGASASAGVHVGAPARRRSLAKRDAEHLAEDNNGTVADVDTPPPPDPVQDAERAGNAAESFFGKVRSARQSFRNNQSQSETGRVDACESKVEIVTPYWASNSAGKIRAIVNTQHFEQAIHQEVCAKSQTKRCTGDCGCEQKYKWHRLLAYDPDNDCKGIFMDWFLFPSCCVCRCNP
ncbi:protein spaetzle 3-like isoform X2 [Thrips palmi]|uniref:Protein spaetzle 3-like isoform X2 n=1 Tax=Thrips palmi TaxID=161013 RepID=A0A6P8XT57_THRPL|nr:protein spaetzle 3-like isoform X2 [Thrips palmi]